ncbi:hypothetical protein ACFPK9_05420 [Rubritalea spongiae]|uniref:Uncharacterized protein n=1 Tax=Rubritalea spongiae TaxID=430797 RepID=A0ABW5E5R4_9BACT
MNKYRLLPSLGLLSAALSIGASAENAMAPIKLSPHFDAVASKLEMGGLSFSYKDKAATQAMVKNLLEMVAAYLDKYTEYKGVNVQQLTDVMTLEAVEAVGNSASQQDGYVHYRSYTYTPEQRSTYAKAYGEMKPSVAMQLAPAGADLVAEMHFNGSYDPDAEEKMYAALGSLGDLLKQLQDQQQNPLADAYQKNYTKINSRLTFIADISPKGFKGFQGLPLGAQCLISITNAMPVWEIFEPLLKEQGLEVEVDGDVVRLVFPEEMMGWKPCLEYHQASGQLFVASTQEYIALCVQASQGKAPNLSSDPEVVKLKEGMPAEFSNMVYVSPNFSRTALSLIQGFGLPQIEEVEYTRPALEMLLQKLQASAITQTGTLYAVSFEEKGTLHVTNSPLNIVGMENHSFTAAATLVGVSTLFTGASYYRDNANAAACAVNMASFQKAVDAVQNIEGYENGDALTWEMIVGEGKPFPEKPICPAGGVYTLSPVFMHGEGSCISCSVSGHDAPLAK